MNPARREIVSGPHRGNVRGTCAPPVRDGTLSVREENGNFLFWQLTTVAVEETSATGNAPGALAGARLSWQATAVAKPLDEAHYIGN